MDQTESSATAAANGATSQAAPAASTSTAAPSSPPPLPFDPTQRQPAPTLGSQEQPSQADAKESKLPGFKRVAPYVGAGLLGLLLMRCAAGAPSTTVINQVPGGTGGSSTTVTTTPVSLVPMRALPTGVKIGGFPVRPSAVMIINGEVETASVAAITYIGQNPGVGVCNLYVGAKAGAEAGYTFSGARTEDNEVKLVDCSTGPDGPVASTTTVAQSATTAPATAPAPAGQ